MLAVASTQKRYRKPPQPLAARQSEGLTNKNLDREDFMATNLVSLVMQFLTPEIIGRVATALGLDRTLVQSAINAAVPGLLAGLGGVATQPGGAQKLAEAAKQETGTLGKFADMLGGGGQSTFIERGSQLLTSLLGAGDQSALVNAIGQFAGLGQGKSGSLLGMLAPIVMGTIARQQSPRGLDASSIASLFASQKDNIAAALPADFGKLLSGSDLLNSLGGAARSTVSAGTQATRAAGAAANVAGHVTQRVGAATSTSYNWLYWLIPIVAIAALLLYLLAKPAEQVAQQGTTIAQNLMVGGVDVSKQATDSIANLRSTLGGVTDAASAEAALPKLRNIAAQIDQVDDLIGRMTPEQRKLLAGIVSPLMPTLNQLFDKVLAIPGVSEVLKPTIDLLKAKLALLTS
jgi:hypothetical protein